MKIVRRSPRTGRENTMDLSVTFDQLRRYQTGDELIQHVFPDLSDAQREFILTGYTPEDWAAMFPAPKVLNADYECAGFHYRILAEDGDMPWAEAIEGQHPAARKAKHLSAAIQCWSDDGKPLS